MFEELPRQNEENENDGKILQETPLFFGGSSQGALPIEEAEESDSTDDYLNEVVGNKAEKLKKSLLRKIEKRGLELRDFSDRDAIAIEPLDFPPPTTEKRDTTQLPVSDRRFIWLDSNLALEILDSHNDKNRPIDPNKVTETAIQMVTGQYQEDNPDGLLFTPEKVLINGQHRLVALVVAEAISPNIKIAMPVEFNKRKELMPVIDTGRARTLGDKAVMQMKDKGVAFSLDGKYKGVNVTYLAKIANSVLNDGNLLEAERLEFIYEHRDLLREFYVLLKDVPIIRYNASWAGAFVKAALPKYYGKDVIYPLAERFANQTFIGKGDPLQVLFINFNKMKEGKKRLQPRERYGLTVKAIRKALLEETVSNLHVTHYDWTEEEARGYKLHGKESKALKAATRKNR